MKNINEFGVQELSVIESTQIGGEGILADAWDILQDIDEHWDEFKCRLENGWNEYEEVCS